MAEWGPLLRGWVVCSLPEGSNPSISAPRGNISTVVTIHRDGCRYDPRMETVAKMVKAPGCDPGMCGFESRQSPLCHHNPRKDTPGFIRGEELRKDTNHEKQEGYCPRRF